jgi:hypothetical protein
MNDKMSIVEGQLYSWGDAIVRVERIENGRVWIRPLHKMFEPVRWRPMDEFAEKAVPYEA